VARARGSRVGRPVAAAESEAGTSAAEGMTGGAHGSATQGAGGGKRLVGWWRLGPEGQLGWAAAGRRGSLRGCGGLRGYCCCRLLGQKG
jgi:hypothetical protein